MIAITADFQHTWREERRGPQRRTRMGVAHLACVASVSSRVIARKLERKQKKRLKGEGEGRTSGSFVPLPLPRHSFFFYSRSNFLDEPREETLATQAIAHPKGFQNCFDVVSVNEMNISLGAEFPRQWNKRKLETSWVLKCSITLLLFLPGLRRWLIVMWI